MAFILFYIAGAVSERTTRHRRRTSLSRLRLWMCNLLARLRGISATVIHCKSINGVIRLQNNKPMSFYSWCKKRPFDSNSTLLHSAWNFLRYLKKGQAMASSSGYQQAGGAFLTQNTISQGKLNTTTDRNWKSTELKGKGKSYSPSPCSTCM